MLNLNLQFIILYIPLFCKCVIFLYEISELFIIFAENMIL